MALANSDPSVVVVTGAASGIGAAVATAFATRGSTVYAVDIDPSFPPSVSAACQCLEVDITDTAACRAVVDRILAEAGRLDVLVNNAGFAVSGPLEDVSVEASRRQFDVLVHGTHAMTRAVLPSMRARGSGRIVMVSSVLGVVASPGLGTYSAAKAAVESLTESLRMELRGTGVSVTVVEPAWVDTGFAETAVDQLPTAEQADAYGWIYDSITDGWVVDGGPLAASPDDVASTVIEAASADPPAARYPVGALGRFIVASRFLPSGFRETATAGFARLSVSARRWWEKLRFGDESSPPDLSTVQLSTGHEVSVPLSTQASVSGVVLSASASGLEQLLPGSLAPLRVSPTRAAMTLLSVDYSRIGTGEIDPYNEVAIIVPAVSTDAVTPLPVVSALSSTLGGYVWQLPVTTEPARALGDEIWGYPKSLAEISITTDDDRTHTELTVDDQRVVSLAVDQPSTWPRRPWELSLSSYTDGGDRLTRIDHTITGALSVRPLSKRFGLFFGDHPWARTLTSLDLGSRALARFGGDCEFTIGVPEAVETGNFPEATDRHL